MKRHLQGVREMASNGESNLPDGIYLVCVDRAQYRWNGHNPFFALRLSVLEPQDLSGRVVSGRLFSSTCAVWKLGWFLRDFLYAPELLSQDEVDEKALSGLHPHNVAPGQPLLPPFSAALQ